MPQYLFGDILKMLGFSSASLTQLIYMSNPTNTLTEEGMMDLVKDAQKYNVEHKISGFLISDDQNIVQLLEGPKKEVLSLFNKIKSDSRHQNIQVQFEDSSRDRTMPFLGMGLCFINSMKNFNQDFYFTRIQAREFSGLIEGRVGEYFRKYLI